MVGHDVEDVPMCVSAVCYEVLEVLAIADFRVELVVIDDVIPVHASCAGLEVREQ